MKSEGSDESEGVKDRLLKAVTPSPRNPVTTPPSPPTLNNPSCDHAFSPFSVTSISDRRMQLHKNNLEVSKPFFPSFLRAINAHTGTYGAYGAYWGACYCPFSACSSSAQEEKKPPTYLSRGFVWRKKRFVPSFNPLSTPFFHARTLS